MPLTPHEQEVLNRITANLQAQDVMVELPFPGPSHDENEDAVTWTSDHDTLQEITDTVNSWDCVAYEDDHLYAALLDIAKFLRANGREIQGFEEKP